MNFVFLCITPSQLRGPGLLLRPILSQASSVGRGGVSLDWRGNTSRGERKVWVSLFRLQAWRKQTHFLFQMYIFESIWWTNDHLLNAKGPDGAFCCNTNFQALLCLVSTNPTSQSILNSVHLVLRMGLNAPCGSILYKQEKFCPQRACVVQSQMHHEDYFPVCVFGCVTRGAGWHVIRSKGWVHVSFPSWLQVMNLKEPVEGVNSCLFSCAC